MNTRSPKPEAPIRRFGRCGRGCPMPNRSDLLEEARRARGSTRRNPAPVIIYQATNGHYLGRTNPATPGLRPDGTCFSNRTSGKLAQGDIGRRYRCATRALGRRSTSRDDDAFAWLCHWRERLTRRFRHRGNHRYVWCLDRRRRRETSR